MMRRLYRYLPPFAGDYSGVGSALYELGGMLCIHDASGCTGNYVGFDEPRSYDSKQLVYCTGLRKNDAILGNEKIYIDKIVQAAKEMKPAFIALVGSPVPMVIGFDFDGVAREVEHLTGLPTFGFDTSGMKGSYKDGVVMAVLKLLERFGPSESISSSNNGKVRSVNILGATPLDISEENLQALRLMLEERGYQINSIFSMDNRIEDYMNFHRANINLAITQAGAIIAQHMEKTYGIPYLAGLPIGEAGSVHYFSCLDQVLEKRKSMEVSQHPVEVAKECPASGRKALILEDGIIASSIRVELLAQGYSQVDVISLFEKDWAVRNLNISFSQSEEDIVKAVNNGIYSLIVADPLILSLYTKKEKRELIAFPKYAISSKLMHQKRWVYLGKSWNDYIKIAENSYDIAVNY
ncbi:MAG: nitrogenase component 1 [Lachnospiraceae bacterium]